jgi:hypothetical protein
MRAEARFNYSSPEFARSAVFRERTHVGAASSTEPPATTTASAAARDARCTWMVSALVR